MSAIRLKQRARDLVLCVRRAQVRMLNCDHCGTEYIRMASRGRKPTRNYCSEYCRVRLSNLANQKLRNCGNCDSEFSTSSSKSRYCSGTCALAAYRRNGGRSGIPKRTWTKTCGWCGERFLPNDHADRAQFCSRSCAGFAKGASRRVADPPKYLTEGHRKQARMKLELAAPGLTQHARQKLLHEWQARGVPCTHCGGACETVDHLVPLNRGGTNYEDNLAPSCRRCNSSRKDKLLTEWKAAA